MKLFSLKTMMALALVASLLLADSPMAEAGKGKGGGRGRARRLAEKVVPSALGFQMADFLLPFMQETEQLLPRAAHREWGGSGLNYYCARCRETQTGKGPKEVRGTAEAWLITLDTAGFTKDELEITVKGNELKVKGRHSCPKAAGGLCIPRDLDRVYDLSTVNIEPGGLGSRRTADGVLQITIPKATAKKVKIEVADEPVPVPDEASASDGSEDQADEPQPGVEAGEADVEAGEPQPRVVDADASGDGVTGTEKTPQA